MKNYDDETPIVMLTVGQLNALINEKVEVDSKQESFDGSGEESYVHGLSGIRRLFNVSHATAQRYKNTILKEAVMQNGRKIIVDRNKAIELFKQSKEK